VNAGRERTSPRAPRLVPLAALRSRHDLIRSAIAVCQEIHRRRKDPAVTAPLRRRQKGRRARGNFLRAVVEVSRLRHERAEGDVLVLARLLDGCDVRTGECGRWKDGKLDGRWSLEDLARDTGLTIHQVERVISDLQAGAPGQQLLYRWQGREKEGEQWRGFVAITKVTRALWEWLGLGGRRDVLLAAERKADHKAKVKVERKEAPRPKPDYYEPPRATPYSVLAFRIGQDHPDWDADQVEAEAQRQWAARPPPGPDPPAE